MAEGKKPDAGTPAKKPSIADIEAAIDEHKYVEITPSGEVFVSDHRPRPTIDEILAEIEMEREGKKPDAAEWATDFALHYGLTDKERGGIEGMLRKCQRETLLWAAQQFMESPDLDWHAYEVAELLERLAEGRQL